MAALAGRGLWEDRCRHFLKIYHMISKTHGYMLSAYLFTHSLNIMYGALIVLDSRHTTFTKMEMVPDRLHGT